MKRSTLYLENSVFGFYYDLRLENKSKMQATRILFDQIKKDIFEAFTSPLTIVELYIAPELLKNKLLALVRDYDIEVNDIDKNEFEILGEKYMAEKIVPEEFRNDARHVAYATLLRVDILVSMNLEHIANE